jgi:hypothetical protein
VLNDKRPERPGNPDGVILRAVVDDQDGVGMLLCTDDGLCDVCLLIVGRHGDEGPHGAGLLPFGIAVCRFLDEKGYSVSVTAVPGGLLSDRAAGKKGVRPGVHRDHSRDAGMRTGVENTPCSVDVLRQRFSSPVSLAA